MPNVTVSMLGGFELVVGSARVTADTLGRRDPLRLAKYLSLAPQRRAHREQVIDALWPEADFDSVSNRLHKAAHFLRKSTGRDDAAVLAGDTVALFPGEEVLIDVAEFERLARDGLDRGDDAALLSARACYAGDLLPYDLYDEWTFHHRQRLRLRFREVLRGLRDYEALVALDPTDEDGHVGVMKGMLRDGDRAGVIHQYELLCRILEEELGVGPSREAEALRDLAAGPAPPESAPRRPRAAPLATQQVRFCTTVDDVRLAYATSGNGPPLVKASNWLTHLDHDWDSAVWRHWWHALSQNHTLIRYDERGCGLSDWDVDADSFSLEAWVRDLETVVDALGLERFPLLGISQGGPIALTYAARHPERVSHVVIFGTCARSTWQRADDRRRRELAALGELIKVSWGSDQPGFRQVYDAKFLPDGPLEIWQAFDQLQRRSTSPRNAYRLWRAFGGLDCSEAARQVEAPTLILHSRDDLVWGFEEAEELHAMVPGSTLVPLESRNHILRADEPAFGDMLDTVERFLAS
ncbi:alpha/beta hydrolase [Microbacterium cremeum]|uniref:alpha/beta hydrolase n=1 Tax=Microbacterium cremeum TaxID=2782169 RepID=UPI001888585E|nr:alpha/beta hydrolase [Microbacterium cremeum]